MNIAPTINLILSIVSALIAIAFYTLNERNFLGYIQYRNGPNNPILTALTIPMADAINLLLKEENNSLTSNINPYSLAPLSIIILAIFLWPVFPHYNQSFFINFNLLFFLTITSISIYATFIAGWSSASNWGLLGAVRGVAQTISYEVSISLILICFIIYLSSINTSTILYTQYSWILVTSAPLSMLWFISIIAETHRSPLDFIEGESELVSGFNIEYSSSLFAIIFIAEYINILLISLFSISVLTSSHSTTELLTNTTILSFLFIWARGSLPRLRYDILINTLWNNFLPVSLIILLMITPIILIINNT